jgi:hypothetical protein
MDAFEQVVSEILWREGFWVRTSVKVELTAEDKKAIGRPSSPRWELDVVAYRSSDNELRVIECKSYLDNPGVGADWIGGVNGSASGRFKLFLESKLREIVLSRLGAQFVSMGLCRPDPSIRLCLACGKIRKGAREALVRHFKENEWELLDEKWFSKHLRAMAKSGYENQVSAIVAKLILRGAVE